MENKIIVEFIKMAGTGHLNGLIITGRQGIGKSYNVVNTLKKEEIPFQLLSGVTSPLSLYHHLYDHRANEVIVLDDTLSLVNNEHAVTVLLNALWSVEKKRTISWSSTSAKVQCPPKYVFDSRLIVICNKLPSNGFSTIIKSRCIVYDMKMNYKEMIKLMYEIAEKNNGIDTEQRKKIVNFMEENSDETVVNFDLRTQYKIEQIYRYDKINWKSLAIELLNKRNKNLVFLKTLLESGKTVKEQIKEWTETGLSRRHYFYLKKKNGEINGTKNV